jgi:adenylate cyclase
VFYSTFQKKIASIWPLLAQHPVRHWLVRRCWPQRGIGIVAPIVVILVLCLRGLGYLQASELALFDQSLRWRPMMPRDPRILIVEVNEADLRALKQWPTNDRILAQAIKQIRAGDPAVIGLDLYRDFPVEPGHAELVEVFQTTPNLIGIAKQNGTDAANKINPPPELDALDQVAVNDLVIDPDGRLRRALLYLTTPDRDFEGLGLRLALTYLEQRGISPPLNAPYLTLKDATFPPLAAQAGSYVNADVGGVQMLLNYRGGVNYFERVALRDVLAGRIAPKQFKDKVVLLGMTAISVKDSFLTPFSGDRNQPLLMPGVEFHAHVTSHILTRVLDRQRALQSLSEPLECLWISVWGISGTALAWRWRFLRRRQWRKVGIVLGLALGLMIGDYLMFLAGWWLPLLPCLLAYGGGIAIIIGDTAYRAGAIRQTFGRYLSNEVVHELLESRDGAQLGGQRRQVTMLMSDLRGFSVIAEQYPPEAVMTLLNHYLAVMTEVIEQHQGTIDEFIGDAILVLFGAPTQRGDDVDRAIRCAVAMQLAMSRLGARLDSQLHPAIVAEVNRLEMGIAIHTGEVVVGNIGSLKRSKYGIVGSHINLTSRIESHTVGGQVLISDATKQTSQLALILGRSFTIQAKGFAQPITVHELQAIEGPQKYWLPNRTTELVRLAKPLLVDCAMLDGKASVPPLRFPGRLAQMSLQEAELVVVTELEWLSNLCLMPQMAIAESEPKTAGIYAKVTEVLEAVGDSYRYRIRFTFIPLNVQAQFRALLQQGVKR